ncbi:histamine H3 receptor-like [Gadus macrocephalus]|uniref:histamine H3 receptor-like n=1 Tax=Gadus macrocephalus TaxID=80720 RepID=UPI0028CB195A|nr:histamine H3 receptor-like [Gadus macrocephalus]
MSEDQLYGSSNSSGYYFGNDSTKIHSNFAFSGPVFVVLVVLMVTLVVVIVLGNALVIFAFKVDKSLRRQCNYYLLNLAISDFLVGAFCIPLYMPYVLTGRWTLGRALCKLWLVMDYLLCSASVFNIVLISYDRFLSVTRAVSYRARQGMPHQAMAKMLGVWLLAFALYGPAIIFWELAVGRSRVPTGQCFAEFYSTWYFLLSASMLEFFSPLLSVAFFHLSIYLSIRRRRILHSRESAPRPPPPPPPEPRVLPRSHHQHHHPHHHHLAAAEAASRAQGKDGPPSSRSLHQHHGGLGARLAMRGSFLSPSSPSSSSSTTSANATAANATGATGKLDLSAACRPSRLARDKKIAKSLAIIVCVFAICWAPYTLLMIIRAACRGRCIPHHWYEVTFWLLWLNSAINPFLYPLCHSSFRRAFARILCPRRRATQSSADLHGSH